MGILEETLSVRIGSTNIEHYESKGYQIPRWVDKRGRLMIKRGTFIEVRVEDLPQQSRVKISKVCDYCGNISNVHYFKIVNQRKNHFKDFCHNCSLKIKVPEVKMNNVKYEESLLFKFPDLIKQWDYKMNKKLTPDKIKPYSNKKVWWKCDVCIEPYDMCIYHRTLEGSSCPYCSNRRVNINNCLATVNPFIASEWHPTKNQDISPDSITDGSDYMAWWKCSNLDCNSEWQARVYSRKMGTGCPLCVDNYKKQNDVYNCLLSFGLNVQLEYRFSDCRFKNTLPFDFAIFNDQEQLRCLIEYDGQHHFKASSNWGGEKAFKLQQKKDNIKTNYCAANNIPLIRIPYWDFKNIGTILTERLTELGVLSPALVDV